MRVEDRQFLVKLNDDLYPPEDKRTQFQKRLAEIGFSTSLEPTPEFREPRTKLTNEEVVRIFQIAKAERLVVEPFCSGMFGGVGASFYEHEQFFGIGPDRLLSITENQLPTLDEESWHRKLLGRGLTEAASKRRPGGIREDAYLLVMSYAATDENRAALEKYGLERPEDRVHYEY